MCENPETIERNVRELTLGLVDALSFEIRPKTLRALREAKDLALARDGIREVAEGISGCNGLEAVCVELRGDDEGLWTSNALALKPSALECLELMLETGFDSIERSEAEYLSVERVVGDSSG